MPRSARALGVALLVVSTSLGTLLGTGPASAADPRQGAPEVGTCYAITAADVAPDQLAADPVDCTATHTALVFDVGELPDYLSWSSPNDQLLASMDASCWSGFRLKYGANRLQLYRSQYAVAYFRPTVDDQAAGARWFSCVLLVADLDGLAPLPDPVPVLSNSLPDSVASCLTSTFVFTICGQPHAWRTSYAFYGSGTSTPKTFKKAAQKTCPKHVTTKKYQYTWLDVAGPKFIIGCLSKTSA